MLQRSGTALEALNRTQDALDMYLRAAQYLSVDHGSLFPFYDHDSLAKTVAKIMLMLRQASRSAIMMSCKAYKHTSIDTIM